ncbi:MAG: hypothetical protein ACYDBV_06500 [Nitrospiria bacterium]
MIPCFFSKGVFIWGKPIFVDKRLNRDEVESKRREIEDALNFITRQADSYDFNS